jgi:hypothetical protein
MTWGGSLKIAAQNGQKTRLNKLKKGKQLPLFQRVAGAHIS